GRARPALGPDPGQRRVPRAPSRPRHDHVAGGLQLGGDVRAAGRRGRARGRDRVAGLFTAQGALETSSEAPFESYVARGLDYSPLVLVYEAQYVGRALAGQLPPNRALVYLSPTVRSVHTVVPFTGRGDTVGRLLSTDPTLIRLAAAHGFRTPDASV